MIELKNVNKTYDKFTALKDINLTIEQGSITAIIGKSGSGKSTLMHVMSGLDRASDGQVIVGGQNLADMKSKQIDAFRATRIGFIFQSFFVEPGQTCYQNIALPLEIKGVPLRQRKQLVQEALENVELADKIDSKASTLSGGQKQRLSIARAIVNKPAYIFADEPTGNLDSVTGEKIMKLLFDLNESSKSTLIIVTHDHDLAAKCQRQIEMKDGIIV